MSPNTSNTHHRSSDLTQEWHLDSLITTHTGTQGERCSERRPHGPTSVHPAPGGSSNKEQRAAGTGGEARRAEKEGFMRAHVTISSPMRQRPYALWPGGARSTEHGGFGPGMGSDVLGIRVDRPGPQGLGEGREGHLSASNPVNAWLRSRECRGGANHGAC